MAGVGLLIGFLVFSPTEIFAPPRIVSIRKGDSMTTAARKLARAGVVRGQIAFIVYAKMTGQAKRVKPGDYAFAAAFGPGFSAEFLLLQWT